MPTYTVDAIEAEWICDEKTPRVKGKRWRVAFYRDLKLYAVIEKAYTKAAAERMAKMAEDAIDTAIERYIREVARIER